MVLFLLRCSYDDRTVTVLWQRNMNVCNVICTKWLIHQCTFSVTYCLVIELVCLQPPVLMAHYWFHFTVGTGHVTEM